MRHELFVVASRSCEGKNDLEQIVIRNAYEAAKITFTDMMGIVTSDLKNLTEKITTLVPTCEEEAVGEKTDCEKVADVGQKVATINEAIGIVNSSYQKLPQGHSIKQIDMANICGDKNLLVE